MIQNGLAINSSEANATTEEMSWDPNSKTFAPSKSTRDTIQIEDFSAILWTRKPYTHSQKAKAIHVQCFHYL